MKKVYQTPALHTISFEGEGIMTPSNGAKINRSAGPANNMDASWSQGKSESSIWDNME